MSITRIPSSGIADGAITQQKLATGVLAIGNLSGVDLTTAPTNGQALVYDSVTNTWKPGGGANAQDLISPFLLMGA